MNLLISSLLSSGSEMYFSTISLNSPILLDLIVCNLGVVNYPHTKKMCGLPAQRIA